MKNLILFDIDGTLIDSPKTENRFSAAIKRLHELEVEITKDYRGFTDQLILMAVLEDEGWSDDQIQRALPELVRELDQVHEETFQKGSIKVLPGVRELLYELRNRDVDLGLVTGNLESVAKRKLEDVELYSYFSVGGFGSDPHSTRAELIQIAIRKAGFKKSIDKVYVVGDTPRDIVAAQEAGITHSVGVANGYRGLEELVEAGAEVVLENFLNTDEVISKLKLS